MYGQRKLPWEPAVHCGWPTNQVEVAGLVDSQSLMDIAMWVDVSSHGPVQRQTAGGRYVQIIPQLPNFTISVDIDGLMLRCTQIQTDKCD